MTVGGQGGDVAGGVTDQGGAATDLRPRTAGPLKVLVDVAGPGQGEDVPAGVADQTGGVGADHPPQVAGALDVFVDFVVGEAQGEDVAAAFADQAAVAGTD